MTPLACFWWGLMDKRQRIKDYIAKHGICHPERIRSALSYCKGGPIRTALIREVLAEVSGLKHLPSPPSPTSVPKKKAAKVKSLEDFRKRHDGFYIVTKILAERLMDGYVTEAELRSMAGLKGDAWRLVAEDETFEDNHVRVDGTTYWGSKTVIREMKAIVGML